MSRELLNSTILNSHATLVNLPSGYGYSHLLDLFNAPIGSDVIEVYPRVHGQQKTENINVEDIVDLQEKTRGISKQPQFFFLFGADSITEAAQNKFLKLLEEPRYNLHFVLVASDTDRLLITIRSRAQLVKISPISAIESHRLLKKFKLDELKSKQIAFLASGLPAEIERLATDNKYFEQNLEIMSLSKKWLSGSTFDKISIIADMKNDRERALLLLEKTIEILGKKLEQSGDFSVQQQIVSLIRAHKKLSAHANVRLVLLSTIWS